MAKPVIGSTGWGGVLNDHLDDMATDIAGRQVAADLDVDTAALVAGGGATEAALSATYAPVGDYAARAEVPVLSEFKIVRHGSFADATRPDADVVYWIGTVTPTNAESGDIINVNDALTLHTSFDPRDLTWHTMLLADETTTADTGAGLQTITDPVSGRVFTQATTAKRPMFVSDKVGGRAAFSFASQTTLSDTFAGVAQPYSFYVVTMQKAANGRAVAFNTPATNPGVAPGTSSGGVTFTASSATSPTTLLGPARTETVSRFAIVHNGASSYIQVNGARTTGTIPDSTFTSLRLGALKDDLTNPLSGYILFVGVKAGAFTDDEVTKLDAWANSYYGLTDFAYPANDSWSWWSRPRAVAIAGKTYVGVTDGSREAGRERATVCINEYSGTSRKVKRHVVADWSADTATDDHNNPALIVRAGKPLVAIYSKHNSDGLLRWRKSTVPIETGIDFATEATKTMPTGTASYAAAHVHGDDIYVMNRWGTSSDVWGVVKSTDWATTFGDSAAVVKATGYQTYVASNLYGDRLRMAASNHPVNGTPPDQNIYYGELDLPTMQVYKSDGTALGTPRLDSTSPVEMNTMELVATPPVAGYRTWVYDVSTGTTPAVVWVSFDNTNRAATATYHYSVRVGGVWQTEDIVAAGATFSASAEPYFGGVQIDADGSLIVSREAAGTWHVERYSTTDNGATWATATLDSSATSKLSRAWPVDALDDLGGFAAFVNENVSHTTYQDFNSTVRPI